MLNEGYTGRVQRNPRVAASGKRSWPVPYRTGGFTILELLVVTVVIVVLAAMILPVLASARETARKTQCRNNLSQLGKAVVMYSEDYSEQMPMVLPLPGESTAELHDGSRKNGLGLLFPGYNRDHRLFFCPGSNHYNEKTFDGWGSTAVVSSFYYRGPVDGMETLLLQGQKAILMDNNRQASIGRHNHGGRFVNMLFSDGRVVGVGDPAQNAAQADPVDVWAWADQQ